MGSLKLTTASSGSVILSPANTASDVTITVPATTATMAINGPAFSAYANAANQTFTTAVITKVVFDAEEFDTANCFDSTTNYRFTPNVAGYYQINAYLSVLSTQGNFRIYKNGSEFKRGNQSNTSNFVGYVATALIYMNGTTDYLEMYFQQSSGSSATSTASSTLTYFQGFLARAA